MDNETIQIDLTLDENGVWTDEPATPEPKGIFGKVKRVAKTAATKLGEFFDEDIREIAKGTAVSGAITAGISLATFAGLAAIAKAFGDSEDPEDLEEDMESSDEI